MILFRASDSRSNDYILDPRFNPERQHEIDFFDSHRSPYYLSDLGGVIRSVSLLSVWPNFFFSSIALDLTGFFTYQRPSHFHSSFTVSFSLVNAIGWGLLLAILFVLVTGIRKRINAQQGA